MKPLYWILIIGGVIVTILGGVMLITRVILDPPKSWWWTGGTIIIFAVIALIVTIIFLILKLRKKKPVEEAVDPKEAEERAKLMLKMDDDHGDNFVRESRTIMRVGQAGTDRTPVLWLMGKGSETKRRIDIIINLANAKKEIEFFFDKDETFVRECIRLIAENPESEVKEERVLGVDEFGRATTTIKTTRQTIAEKKEQEEKEKAEESNAY
ncbi:hypothetical protein M0R04_09600 [Candidatus Dojkabacteria bacterium]|jgi:hypothetical protein|nr:hypothetical protein [Candidatus Dojkabacteria bacterium]